MDHPAQPTSKHVWDHMPFFEPQARMPRSAPMAALGASVVPCGFWPAGWHAQLSVSPTRSGGSQAGLVLLPYVSYETASESEGYNARGDH